MPGLRPDRSLGTGKSSASHGSRLATSKSAKGRTKRAQGLRSGCSPGATPSATPAGALSSRAAKGRIIHRQGVGAVKRALQPGVFESSTSATYASSTERAILADAQEDGDDIEVMTSANLSNLLLHLAVFTSVISATFASSTTPISSSEIQENLNSDVEGASGAHAARRRDPPGFGDGGAHGTIIKDAAGASHSLTHWVR